MSERKRYGARGSRGVTLVEILVVIAIMGILATIAYPSYEQSIAKTWRHHAIGCLEELAQGMERRFNAAMSYVGTQPPPNGCVANGDPNWVVPDDDLRARYRFAFAEVPTAAAFTVTAVPIGRQAAADARCGTLSLDQAGRKSISGGIDVTACW